MIPYQPSKGEAPGLAQDCFLPLRPGLEANLEFVAARIAGVSADFTEFNDLLTKKL